MHKKYQFEAEIYSGDGGGAYVLFPCDVQKEFGVKGRVPVKTTIDGEPYTGSLVKYGNPLHMLPVLKGVRAKINKNVGDTASVILTRDDAERIIETPADLRKALKTAKLDSVFDKMSFSHRKEYIVWIEGAKKPETRANRVGKTIEKLSLKASK